MRDVRESSWKKSYLENLAVLLNRDCCHLLLPCLSPVSDWEMLSFVGVLLVLTRTLLSIVLACEPQNEGAVSVGLQSGMGMHAPRLFLG